MILPLPFLCHPLQRLKETPSFFNTAGAVQNKTQKQGVPLRFVNQTPSIMSQKISLLPTPAQAFRSGKADLRGKLCQSESH